MAEQQTRYGCRSSRKNPRSVEQKIIVCACDQAGDGRWPGCLAAGYEHKHAAKRCATNFELFWSRNYLDITVEALSAVSESGMCARGTMYTTPTTGSSWNTDENCIPTFASTTCTWIKISSLASVRSKRKSHPVCWKAKAK